MFGVSRDDDRADNSSNDCMGCADAGYAESLAVGWGGVERLRGRERGGAGKEDEEQE